MLTRAAGNLAAEMEILISVSAPHLSKGPITDLRCSSRGDDGWGGIAGLSSGGAGEMHGAALLGRDRL